MKNQSQFLIAVVCSIYIGFTSAEPAKYQVSIENSHSQSYGPYQLTESSIIYNFTFNSSKLKLTDQQILEITLSFYSSTNTALYPIMFLYDQYPSSLPSYNQTTKNWTQSNSLKSWSMYEWMNRVRDQIHVKYEISTESQNDLYLVVMNQFQSNQLSNGKTYSHQHFVRTQISSLLDETTCLNNCNNGTCRMFSSTQMAQCVCPSSVFGYDCSQNYQQVSSSLTTRASLNTSSDYKIYKVINRNTQVNLQFINTTGNIQILIKLIRDDVNSEYVVPNEVNYDYKLQFQNQSSIIKQNNTLSIQSEDSSVVYIRIDLVNKSTSDQNGSIYFSILLSTTVESDVLNQTTIIIVAIIASIAIFSVLIVLSISIIKARKQSKAKAEQVTLNDLEQIMEAQLEDKSKQTFQSNVQESQPIKSLTPKNAPTIRSKRFKRRRYFEFKKVLFRMKNKGYIPKECILCKVKLENRDFCRMLSCFHTFHQACIDDWFQDNISCPQCNKKFVNKMDFLIDTSNLHKTIEVDNEHFYSDHIVLKKAMVGTYTFNQVIDPSGKIKVREKRHSFDVNDLMRSHKLINEESLFQDGDGPLKILKLLNTSAPNLVDKSCDFVFHDVNEQYEEQKQQWETIVHLTTINNDYDTEVDTKHKIRNKREKRIGDQRRRAFQEAQSNSNNNTNNDYGNFKENKSKQRENILGKQELQMKSKGFQKSKDRYSSSNNQGTKEDKPIVVEDVITLQSYYQDYSMRSSNSIMNFEIDQGIENCQARNLSLSSDIQIVNQSEQHKVVPLKGKDTIQSKLKNKIKTAIKTLIQQGTNE